MKLKKIVSAALTGAMLASTALIGVTAAETNTLPFTDVNAKDWFYGAVQEAYDEGIMTGKSDTVFDPRANITRAEVVTAFARIACTDIEGKGDKLTFTDTKSGKWYSDAVGWAADNGIVKGRGDGRFSPSDNITRAELASIIINFVKYMELKLPDNPKIDKFSDADSFDGWMKEPVEAVRKTGLMQGVGGMFNPTGTASRGEIAEVVKNLLPGVGRNVVVEDGKTDYVIVIDTENEGAVDAADRLAYQIEYTTGSVIDIVDDSTAETANEIVIGETNRTSGIDTAKLTGNGYEIKPADGKIFIGSADADGLYRGAVRFALTCTSGDDVRFTAKSAARDEFKYPIGKLTINGNDISKYTVLYPAGASENTMTGVNDLVEYIEKACGVKLEAKEGTSGDFAIIIEEKEIDVEGSPENNYDNFAIKSEGNNIRISGHAVRGAMYGCYDFLEDVLGWVFLTETQDYLSPVDELDIKSLDYSEGSVIESREIYWGTYISNKDMRNKHKLWKMPWTGGSCHTFATLDNDYETGNMNTDQSDNPCLTDDYIYEVMKKNVLALLEKNPDAKLISISQNDTWNHCECDRCLASDAKYGGSPAGTLIWFVNKLSDAIVEAGYDDVLIHTFAYTYTLPVPTGIKPNDNIVVQVCSIDACFSHPLDDGAMNTKYFADNLRAWSAICDKMYIWDYTTNFSYGPSPFANIKYEVLAANVKLFADNNAMGIFEQGNHNVVKERGEFDRLRAYLLAKLAWDPYMTEEEYDAQIKKYMEGYFGEGWEIAYEAMKLWLERDITCQAIYDEINGGRRMSLMGISPDLVDMFNEAELYAETKKQFDNLDLTQIQFEYLDLTIRFDGLYNSGNPDDVALSQELCKALQDKILKFGVSLGNQALDYPNMTEFTTDPSQWRWTEGACVGSLDKVTVDYPKLNYAR